MTLSIAVLDDYQGRSADAADWASVQDSKLTVFNEHLGDDDAVATALADFDVIVCMRERTLLPASVIDRLSSAKLIVTAGMRNLGIDMAAARARGVDRLAGSDPLPQSGLLRGVRAEAGDGSPCGN